MKAAEFVEKLKLQAPNHKYLRLYGFSENDENELLEKYTCIWKGTNIELGDDLLNLIANYDLSKVEIGMVSFNNSIETDGDYYILGNDETCPLIMNRFNYEISVRDFINFDFVVCECAENGEKFLDALIAFGDFVVKTRDLEFDTPVDNALISSKIEECTQLAGGEKYRTYYEAMIF